jgi:hypothetical protein
MRPMNKDRHLSLEQSLYVLAAIIAVGIRLFNLGKIPLSDYEAGWALQSLDLSRGVYSLIGSQSLYVVFSTMVFFILGASNFAARLLPALMGVLLAVLSPMLFRNWLGKKTALVLAFALALDPGAAAISRLAASPIVSAACMSIALGAWYLRLPVLTGIFAGLLLLSGPAWIPGVIGLLLALGIDRLIRGQKIFINDGSDRSDDVVERPAFVLGFIKQTIIAGVITIIGAGSLLMLTPRGLSAAATALPDYLAGWRLASGVSVWQMFGALFVYEPLAVILAFTGMIKAWLNGHRQDQFFSIWFMAAILLACLYPSRQTADLIWVLIPMWGLASRQIMEMLKFDNEDINPLLGQAAMTFVMLLFIGLNFSSMVMGFQDPTQINLRWIVIAGAFVLLGLVSVLISLGWTTRAMRKGLALGAGVVLFLYSLSAMWSAAGLRSPTSHELWQPAPATGQADLLLNTLGDLAEWNTGVRQKIDIYVVGVNSPALQWTLRDYATVNFADHVPFQILPSIIITPQGETVSLAAAYRGQDLVWRRLPNWDDASLLDSVKWMMYRQIPQRDAAITLWARNDLFPSGKIVKEAGS